MAAIPDGDEATRTTKQRMEFKIIQVPGAEYFEVSHIKMLSLCLLKIDHITIHF
jgi:hypothetical protein